MLSQTKIVGTIGPKTCSPEALLMLAEAGLNVARLNGSHNSLDWHRAAIVQIKETLPDFPILLDIPGRKIRTCVLREEPQFEAEDILILTSDASSKNVRLIPVNYPNFHEIVTEGATIFADDGMLSFEVVSIQGREVHCRALVAGKLKSSKGVNVPNSKISTPLVADRDREFITFAVEQSVDFVGISFVDSKDHVEAIRNVIGGSSPRIVAKIENWNGLENVDEITEASDALMVDRGDLSVETEYSRVALFQKQIIAAARRHGKPVIVATEMLHSMIENPFPTKAEISDITNAVVDGCAAIMLSGETAIGIHPNVAVRTMREIASAAEDHVQQTIDNKEIDSDDGVPDVMSMAIAQISRALPITKLLAITRSGFAARMMAAQRPRQPILAVSDDPVAARSFNLFPGTTGVCVDIPFSRTSTDHIPACIKYLRSSGHLSDDDMILVSSVGYPRSGNRMNLLQTHVVSDLVETFRW